MFRLNKAKILPIFFSRRASISEFAKAANINPSTLSRALQGRRVHPSTAQKLCEALRIEKNIVDYLMPED